MRYFGQNDQIHPSVTGVRLILGTINEKVAIVHDFAKSTFQRPGDSYRKNNGLSGFHQPPFNVNNRCLKCLESSHETYQCRHKNPNYLLVLRFIKPQVRILLEPGEWQRSGAFSKS